MARRRTRPTSNVLVALGSANREPMAISAPASNASRRLLMVAGSCWPSASTTTTRPYPSSTA